MCEKTFKRNTEGGELHEGSASSVRLLEYSFSHFTLTRPKRGGERSRGTRDPTAARAICLAPLPGGIGTPFFLPHPPSENKPEIKTSRGFVKVEVLRRLDGGSPSHGTVRQLLRFMTYHAEGVGEITVRNELQPRKRGTVKVATNAENYSIGWMTATAMCAQMSRT